MDFYTNPLSPNCRKVDAVAKQLGIPLNEKQVDVIKGQKVIKKVRRDVARREEAPQPRAKRSTATPTADRSADRDPISDYPDDFESELPK